MFEITVVYKNKSTLMFYKISEERLNQILVTEANEASFVFVHKNNKLIRICADIFVDGPQGKEVW